METIQELAPSEGLQSRPPEPGPKGDSADLRGVSQSARVEGDQVSQGAGPRHAQSKGAQPPVSRANSTRCQGTLTRRPQEKSTSSLRASFFRVTLQLWKVACSLQIPKQHFRKEAREGEVLEETERFNPINSPCYLRELFNWTKFEMDLNS